MRKGYVHAPGKMKKFNFNWPAINRCIPIKPVKQSKVLLAILSSRRILIKMNRYARQKQTYNNPIPSFKGIISTD